MDWVALPIGSSPWPCLRTWAEPGLIRAHWGRPPPGAFQVTHLPGSRPSFLPFPALLSKVPRETGRSESEKLEDALRLSLKKEPRTVGSVEKLGKARKHSLLEPTKGTQPFDNLTLGFLTSRLGENTFVLFKPLYLWSLVTAATGN